MAKSNRDERKAQVRLWQESQQAELAASMPLSPPQWRALLDWLDANLRSCDHSLRLTETFLQSERLEASRLLPWLAEHGGSCDCEVLANLDELAQTFDGAPPPPAPKSKPQPRPARVLTTATGWRFDRLPPPWRIANLYKPAEPLQIQMGKKGGCMLTLWESPPPLGNPATDDDWSQLWYARTQLPPKSPPHVTRGALDLPPHLRSVLVQTPSWTPVYCWIVPESQDWRLEVHTELNRQQGDLPQVAQLIRRLAADAQ